PVPERSSVADQDARSARRAHPEPPGGSLVHGRRGSGHVPRRGHAGAGPGGRLVPGSRGCGAPARSRRRSSTPGIGDVAAGRHIVRRLDGEVAIVTGAAQGIGAATARRLAEEGAAVLVTDLRDAGAEVADALTQAGANAAFTPLDVTQEAAWTRAVAACRE